VLTEILAHGWDDLIDVSPAAWIAGLKGFAVARSRQHGVADSREASLRTKECDGYARAEHSRDLAGRVTEQQVPCTEKVMPLVGTVRSLVLATKGGATGAAARAMGAASEIKRHELSHRLPMIPFAGGGRGQAGTLSARQTVGHSGEDCDKGA